MWVFHGMIICSTLCSPGFQNPACRLQAVQAMVDLMGSQKGHPPIKTGKSKYNKHMGIYFLFCVLESTLPHGSPEIQKKHEFEKLIFSKKYET